MFLSRSAYFAVTVSLLATAGIASAQGTAAPKPVAPKPAPMVKLPANVVARVNGTDITYDELSATTKAWAGRPIVQEIIQQKAIEQEAKKFGVTVTPAEVQAEIKNVKQKQIEAQTTQPGGMMTWGQIAKRDNLSDGYLNDKIRLSLIARKTFAKFLEKNAPGLDGQIKVAHILVANRDLEPKPDAKPPTPEEEAKRDADAKAKADQILADIKSGKIKFEDAAKQMSDDKASGMNGGAMDYAPKGSYVAPFEDAAYKLEKPGDITAVPVKSQFGYHIIKLISKGANASAAEKAAYKKKAVDQQMKNPQAINQWVQYVVGQSVVTFNPPVAPAVPAKAPAKAPAAKPKP